MKDIFSCKRAEYSFVNADYQRGALNHGIEYSLYVKCALIILLKKEEPNKEEIANAIELLDAYPTVENTNKVLTTLSSKNILF